MTDGLEVRWVAADDPLLEPLVADLARDYDERYEPTNGVPSSAELTRYPASAFTAAEGGAFVALVEVAGDGSLRLLAGGALKRGRPGPEGRPLGELKRMWTSPEHRRRGLAGRVLAELEHRAADLGYTGLELTTGARQPEAVALYLRHGWTPDFDLDDDWEAVSYLRFTKGAPTKRAPTRPAPARR
ncbi:MAG TPA: GNAT family N-acetyltransferase [Amnibacterium sp.]|uniref:GNAT family N-acetyltransferase n=1 Tax=Amnibacterium sp. TaxID=1872496 RepID=UPI002F93A4F1